MPHHAPELRHRALSLLRAGTTNAEVGRRLNIPAGTISYWKHMDRAGRGECDAAMRAVFPDNSVCRVRRAGCSNLKVYSKHLACLFPQHGLGKKHERKITLAAWQQEVVDRYPWQFVRGLIHSDGCRNMNWTTRIVNGERKRYEYPRYFFTNVSDDIRQLCTDTLDKLGVEWKHCTRNGRPYSISVARRASVVLMDAHVGPKC
ncbi:helix-turn-helix domain-containing protein [Streptomyces sp. NPDC006540]|uniref:helix-turn-helix domain-containing protein n=1 Tax=Streptomyces sp. NPDC006540 TaxID=3155353 RepID=UPI0033A0CC3B